MPGRGHGRRGGGELAAWIMTIGGGLLLWIAASLLGDRKEAWDSPLYWQLAYPAGLLLCGWLGWRFPRRPWRWPVAMMASQAVALCMSAASFGLLPLGLVAFLLLTLPGIGIAALVARFSPHRR